MTTEESRFLHAKWVLLEISSVVKDPEILAIFRLENRTYSIRKIQALTFTSNDSREISQTDFRVVIESSKEPIAVVFSRYYRTAPHPALDRAIHAIETELALSKSFASLTVLSLNEIVRQVEANNPYNFFKPSNLKERIEKDDLSIYP